jgi:hemolysin activation/secretion protein
MIPGWCRIIAAAAMLTASLPAVAQVIPPSELPGRERERFQEPVAPRAQPGGSPITLPSTVAPPGAENIIVRLRGVRIEGATVYGGEELATFYRDLVGREVPLTAIYDIAQRITAHYGNAGYVLTRAIVPPQQLNPGGAVIRIQVIEGYVDNVEWPAALSGYRDFFSEYTAKIIANRPTNIKTIERYLLLAGDLPGLKFKNSLKPSPTRPGAATLVVEVIEKPIDAIARVDNRGSKARGPEQFFTSVTANNIFRMHEAFTLAYASAFQPRELQYYYGGYRQVLTSEGLTAFINTSFSPSKPGLPVDPALKYRTRDYVTEAGLSYPFIRQRERNLVFTGLGFMSDDQSDIVAGPLFRDRIRGVRVKAEGDLADELKGINQLNVVFSHGIEGLGSTRNDNPLASRPGARVDFAKLEVTASRLQQLFANWSLLVAAYGQYGFTSLLTPELCSYGGRVFGRAFDPSEMVGDSCFLQLAELRTELPITGNYLTQAQLYAFIDHGRLYNHNVAPVSTTLGGVDAASVGGGIRLGWQSYLTTDLSLAKAVEGPRDDTRFFFIVTGRY